MKTSLLLNAGKKKKIEYKNMFSKNKEEKFKSINKNKKGGNGGISPNLEEFNNMMSKASGGSVKSGKKSLLKKKN